MAINLATVKQLSTGPLGLGIFEHLCCALVFTTLNLWNAGHLICFNEGDTSTTMCQTRSSQFKYWVIPPGLGNAPATVQVFVDDCLRPCIDDFAVCFILNIQIDTNNKKEHKDHIQTLLEWLQQFSLYSKAKNWQFRASDISFLGFISSSDRVWMESDHISAIEDWPPPKSFWDAQVLLGFRKFYRWFISTYAKAMTPIADLQKNLPGIWEWTGKAKLAVQILTKIFTKAPIHQQFNQAQAGILQTASGGFTITSILNQYDGFRILRLVDFYLRKCFTAWQNYNTYNR